MELVMNRKKLAIMQEMCHYCAKRMEHLRSRPVAKQGERHRTI